MCHSREEFAECHSREGTYRFVIPGTSRFVIPAKVGIYFRIMKTYFVYILGKIKPAVPYTYESQMILQEESENIDQVKSQVLQKNTIFTTYCITRQQNTSIMPFIEKNNSKSGIENGKKISSAP